MHLLASLTTVLALGATIASAAPAAAPEVDSRNLVTRSDTDILEECKTAGVDVYGPIPDDYLDYDEELGRYHFGPGSKASLWTAAQGSIEETTSDHEKRQTWANIGIGMWAQDGCRGEGYYFDNVRYGVHHYASVNLFSWRIDYRGVRNNEQLDFSRSNGRGDWCGTYSFSAPANAGTGCRNSQLINCFNLKFR